MTNYLKDLGFTDDEAAALRERYDREKNEGGQDRRICICGHPMHFHHSAYGVTRCRTGRMACPCGFPIPVLEVSDTRAFKNRTNGPGGDHALLRGIVAAERSSEKTRVPFTLEWVVELWCQRCSGEKRESEGKVLPVAVTPSLSVSYEPERMNALLCERCIRELVQGVTPS